MARNRRTREPAARDRSPAGGDRLGADVTAAGPSVRSRVRSQWVIVALLVASIFLNYIDRGALSIAAPVIAREFALSPERIGWLLSAFFWSYALLQLFGISGWIADRFPSAAVLA